MNNKLSEYYEVYFSRAQKYKIKFKYKAVEKKISGGKCFLD